MDERLQKLVDSLTEKFGLDHYKLETYSFHKGKNSIGEEYYKCNLEFFPETITEQLEEDINPPGTAIIDYNLTEQTVMSITFVDGLSFSIKTPFKEQTVQEVASWIEKETNYLYERDFRFSDSEASGYRFKTEIHGYASSPGGLIEVEFDELGKLTSFFLYDMTANQETVEQENFALTLEDIEQIVKKQVTLVQFPNEVEKKFVPVYAIDEVYITNDGKRIIPYFVHERDDVIVNERLAWTTPLEGEIERQPIYPFSTVTLDEAFANKETLKKQSIPESQIKEIIPMVKDVLRTVLPDDSNKWTLQTIKKEEYFIEVMCAWNEENTTYFNRKFVVLLNPTTLDVLNYMDNGEMFEVFDTFTQAPIAKISHEEAFEKLLPSITLTPTYVYDFTTEKFVLCGLLDAADGIDAITGEVLPLSIF